MQKTVRKLLRAVGDYDPDYYDMYADANETCFAQLYLEYITRHAETQGIRPPATVLEAGCQAGRLVVPLAKRGFRVTGIDTSGFALRRAREHAKAAGVDATFVRGDLLEVLRGGATRPFNSRHGLWPWARASTPLGTSPERSRGTRSGFRPTGGGKGATGSARGAPQYDLVVCAEVVYLSRRYQEMLQVLSAAVRPGGMLCVSHRPKFYYLLEALKQYDLSTAFEVSRRSEGAFRDSEYYNWQTEEELRALYRSLGLRWVAMYPIDRVAWLSGVSPAQLSDTQRAQWFELEVGGAAEAGTCARYVLVVAAKPSERSAG